MTLPTSATNRVFTMKPEDKIACCPSEPCEPDCCSPLASDGELARLAKALAHPLRVRILRVLASRSSCICGELVDLLPVAQSTVSQHLKVLKDAGLVQGEVDGPRTCYCLDPRGLALVKDLISKL